MYSSTNASIEDPSARTGDDRGFPQRKARGLDRIASSLGPTCRPDVSLRGVIGVLGIGVAAGKTCGGGGGGGGGGNAHNGGN